MTHRDFTLWLRGFLTNKKQLDEAGITTIQETLKDVHDEPKVTTFPISDPNTFPKWQEPHIQPPFNPTCDTGKQLLTDVYGPGEDDYGRKTKLQ